MRLDIDKPCPRCCDKCKATFLGSAVDAKVKKFETDIDDISSGNAEELEKLLRRMRYFLHENHYWVLDVKRKLIDIYGNKPGFELYKLPKVSNLTTVPCCFNMLRY